MLLKKRIEKTFDYPDMNAKVSIVAYVHKVSYRDAQERKRKAINFLKAVNKSDREKLINALNARNIGVVLANIEDMNAVSDLLGSLEENIRLCLKDSLEIIATDESGVEEKLIGQAAEKGLLKDQIDWLAQECIAVNPELFNPGILEKKKN